MKCNEGFIDRIIRFVIAIVFLVVAIKYSWWWIIVTVVALVTALIGWCPTYTLVGINTCKKVAVKKAKKKKKIKKVLF